MSKIFAAVIAVFLTSYAFGQDSVIVGLGTGNSSCGDWIKARREQNKRYELLAVSWVQGFLSGININQEKDQRISLPAASVIEAILDKECAESPTEPIYTRSLLMNAKLQLEQGKKPSMPRSLE